MLHIGYVLIEFFNVLYFVAMEIFLFPFLFLITSNTFSLSFLFSFNNSKLVFAMHNLSVFFQIDVEGHWCVPTQLCTLHAGLFYRSGHEISKHTFPPLYLQSVCSRWVLRFQLSKKSFIFWNPKTCLVSFFVGHKN